MVGAYGKGSVVHAQSVNLAPVTLAERDGCKLTTI